MDAVGCLVDALVHSLDHGFHGHTCLRKVEGRHRFDLGQHISVVLDAAGDKPSHHRIAQPTNAMRKNLIELFGRQGCRSIRQLSSNRIIVQPLIARPSLEAVAARIRGSADKRTINPDLEAREGRLMKVEARNLGKFVIATSDNQRRHQRLNGGVEPAHIDEAVFPRLSDRFRQYSKVLPTNKPCGPKKILFRIPDVSSASQTIAGGDLKGPLDGCAAAAIACVDRNSVCQDTIIAVKTLMIYGVARPNDEIAILLFKYGPYLLRRSTDVDRKTSLRLMFRHRVFSSG